MSTHLTPRKMKKRKSRISVGEKRKKSPRETYETMVPGKSGTAMDLKVVKKKKTPRRERIFHSLSASDVEFDDSSDDELDEIAPSTDSTSEDSVDELLFQLESDDSESSSFELDDANAVVTVQSFFRRFHGLQRKFIAKKKNKRVHNVLEILKTEKNYIATLSTVVRVFLRPLTKEMEEFGISMEDLDMIFSNIELLNDVNENLGKEITEITQDFDPELSLIAPNFTKFATSCQSYYEVYILNYVNVRPAIQRLKENIEFKHWIAKQERKPVCKKQDLEGMLIQPIQRLGQYKLLLEELLSNTWTSHPDYESLVQSVKDVLHMGESVNEKARDRESLEKVIELSGQFENFNGLDQVKTRRFKDKYVVHEWIDDIDEEIKKVKRDIFFFNDIILYTEQIGVGNFRVLNYAYFKSPKLLCQDWDINGNRALLLKIKSTNHVITIRGSEKHGSFKELFIELKNIAPVDKPLKKTKEKTDTRKSSSLADDWRDTVELLNNNEKINDFLVANHKIPVFSTNVEVDSRRVLLTITTQQVLLFQKMKSSEPAIYNLYDLEEISVPPTYINLELVFSDRRVVITSPNVLLILNYIRECHFTLYPSINIDSQIMIHDATQLWEVNFKTLPCGGFTSVYEHVCQHLEIPARNDVVWELLNIIAPSETLTLDLDRFIGLSEDDLRGLLLALVKTDFFERLIVSLPSSLPVSSALADVFAKSPSVNEIVLRGPGLKDYFPVICEGITHSKRYRTLFELDLSDTDLNDKNMKELGNCISTSATSIQVLKLDNLRYVSREAWKIFFETISHLKDMLVLSLRNSSFTRKGTGFFCDWMRNCSELSELYLSNLTCKLYSSITDGIIQNGVYLQKLDLTGFQFMPTFGDELTNFLSLCNLTYFSMSHTNLGSNLLSLMIPAIENNVLVNDLILDISSCMVEMGESFVACCSLLKRVQNINTLDISDNRIGDEGLALLIRSLKSSLHDIRVLKTNRNAKFRSEKSRVDVRNALRDFALSKNNKITTLHIQGMSKEGGQLQGSLSPFFLGLRNNSTLQELDVSGHNIGYMGMVYLCIGLEANETLKILYWDENNPTIDGYRRFHEAMKYSSLIYCPIPMLDLKQQLTTWDSGTKTMILQIMADIQNQIALKKEKEIRRLFEVQMTKEMETIEKLKKKKEELRLGSSNSEKFELEDKKIRRKSGTAKTQFRKNKNVSSRAINVGRSKKHADSFNTNDTPVTGKSLKLKGSRRRS